MYKDKKLNNCIIIFRKRFKVNSYEKYTLCKANKFKEESQNILHKYKLFNGLSEYITGAKIPFL